uniref:Uncharacterized protein n=1 Tax=Caenorhabditis japonica TaxID=281687 RepID=A0A8R1DQA1_CAEJA
MAHPAVLNAKSLQVHTWTQISDEQFLQLTALKMNINSVSMSSDVFLEFLRVTDGLYCEIEKQDDPLCVVSIFVTNCHLAMMRTGFACVRDGRSGIEYRIPRV